MSVTATYPALQHAEVTPTITISVDTPEPPRAREPPVEELRGAVRAALDVAKGGAPMPIVIGLRATLQLLIAAPKLTPEARSDAIALAKEALAAFVTDHANLR